MLRAAGRAAPRVRRRARGAREHARGRAKPASHMRAALIGLLLLLPPAATVASNWQEQARVHGGRKPHGSDPPPRVVPCEAPVRRAEVVLPASLLTSRRPLPFRMHSGYINVTEEDYLFYWHFESQLAAGAWTSNPRPCLSFRPCLPFSLPLTRTRVRGCET